MSRNNRTFDETRPIQFEMDYTKHADGSVLVSFGDTKVICTAFMEEKVPPWLRNQKRGWVTAEYGMLPGSTHTRGSREAARGKQSGRTVEISRLIGRSLRTCIDLEKLGERMITVDCDVIQADGGTRTASITGGCVALLAAIWKHREELEASPIIGRAAAISLGIVENETRVDLDYEEDSSAEVDLNLVLDHEMRFIEIQGTAEGVPFSDEQLQQILSKGRAAIRLIGEKQREALLTWGVAEEWVP